MVTSEHIHIGAVVALNSGLIAQIVEVKSQTTVGLQYPGRPITFHEEVANLRYLGEEYQPLKATKSLDELIQARNAKGMQLLLGHAVGRKTKASPEKVKAKKKAETEDRKKFLEAVTSASTPEEVQALLRSRGLLSIAPATPNPKATEGEPTKKEEVQA